MVMHIIAFSVLLAAFVALEIHWRHIYWPEYMWQSKQAEDFRKFLTRKLKLMQENPFSNDADWREILPVCRYVDEWYACIHPFERNFVSLEEQVAHELEGDDVEMA